MLKIRFFRVGKKNQPSFKIIVTDKRRPPRGGRFVEGVGFWNPLTKEKVLRTERIKYWLSVGAKPSDSVHNLLIKEKILKGKKIPVHLHTKRGQPAEGGKIGETSPRYGVGVNKKKKEIKQPVVPVVPKKLDKNP